MLIHLYIGRVLEYGWMTGLVLLHKGILGHFMQKDTKKHDFWDLMLLILEHVALG